MFFSISHLFLRWKGKSLQTNWMGGYGRIPLDPPLGCLKSCVSIVGLFEIGAQHNFLHRHYSRTNKKSTHYPPFILHYDHEGCLAWRLQWIPKKQELQHDCMSKANCYVVGVLAAETREDKDLLKVPQQQTPNVATGLTTKDVRIAILCSMFCLNN